MGDDREEAENPTSAHSTEHPKHLTGQASETR